MIMIVKKFFRFFIKDKIVFFGFLISFVVNAAIWVNLLKIKRVEGLIPLHYNIYFGIDYMGEWYKIFTLPFIGLTILFINLILSIFVYFKDKLIAHILLISALFVQIILFLASLAIVWINI